MKKIITLAALTFFVASAFAQYNDDDNRVDIDKRRDVEYRGGRGGYDNNNRLYVYNNRRRDREIARINWEYDERIQSIRYRWFMSRQRKEAIICSLEEDRRREIRMIYEKYNCQKDGWDDYNHHDRNW